MMTQQNRRSSRGGDASRVSEFFAWLGGAHAELVRDHPEERMRLSAIGATILFTGIFAALSSGYAFFSVFGWTLWVPVLAVLWSCMIVNIDRLVVMTIHGSFWQKVGGAVPRLLLAAFIAIVIARPLELWIFAPEVKRAMAQDELRVRSVAADRLNRAERSAHSAFDGELASLRTRLNVDGLRAAAAGSEQRIAECRRGQDRLQEEWFREMNDGAGGRMAGNGPVSRQKEQTFLRKRDECNLLIGSAQSARQSADGAESRFVASIRDSESARDTALMRARREFEEAIAALNDTRAESLLARERALSALSSTEPDVRRMLLVVTFLFLLVEILPVSAKLMAGSTVYDAIILQREKTTTAVMNGALSAEAELSQAGELSTGLRAQLLRQHAKFRRRALALQRMAVRDVLSQARMRWKVPSAEVDAMMEAMTDAVHEAVREGSVSMADGTSKREDLKRRGFAESISDLGQYYRVIWRGVLVFFGGASVVVISYNILGGVDPFSKTDLTIALTIGGIVVSALISILSLEQGRFSHNVEGGRK